MNARSHLIELMSQGRQPVGIFVSSLDPASTDIMALAGVDFVVIDAEHGRFGRADIENHVRAANLGGILPFVRILENSPILIQSTLDLGAQGVLVPHVDTADDARSAVAASRYAPRGKRGMCPACNAGGYGMGGWSAHVDASDANVLIIPILESRKSIENVDEILAVDGIDIVMYGPGDLSADMGIDFVKDGHLLVGAWQTMLAATKQAGKSALAPCGLGFDDADMLIIEMELMLLRKTVARMVDETRAHHASRS
ncbi:HpcH/HpaI aldolase family protein [Sphingobium sp. AP50]|uniref:HpcH/HpaI aldolase family protein n=1 Tax=Sphingobium sp. AP50 TaxID=1884369 RepID=UPI00210C4A21|nr:aldolase/citrate lyase family protein [Sphingobium sp. AP50]